MRGYSSLLVLVLGSFSILTANTYAADSFTYKCECIDTGYECEGSEVMNLTVDSENASYTVADNNGDVYNSDKVKAEFDVKYAPKKNKDFSRYTISNSKNYPNLLIETAMIGGASSGSVKLPEFFDNGEFAHQWEFDCSAAK